MTKEIADGHLTGLSPFLIRAHYVTWAIPLILWADYCLFLIPTFNAEGYHVQLSVMMRFLILSGSLMTACLVPAVYIFIRRRSWRTLLPILLNLTWLYYVRVILYGVSIHDLCP